MMSVALDFTDNKDLDYSKLLSQNKALQSELKQCQADKDFVWSLWKRLQVSNPDVTEAISLVIQREKEKGEAKDHKVLEILQVKDDRIEELQNIVAKQAQEISELLSKKVDLQEKNGRIQSQADNLHDKLTTLELKLKGHETKERSMDETYRRTVEDGQREKHDLQRQVTSLTTELEVAREEKASVAAKRFELERTVRNLERDVSEKISRFDGLIRELEESRRQGDKAERQVQQLTHEVDFKNQELETVRKELKELWNSHNQLTEHSAQQAELIRQLQSLQHDTQIMIKNQEDAFSVETNSMQQMYQDLTTRYERAKQTETELRQQILELKKELLDREDAVSKLQNQTKALREHLNTVNNGGSFLDIVAADHSTLEARRDLEALRQLERTIEKLDQSLDEVEDATLDFPPTQRSGRHSTPSRVGDDGDFGRFSGRSRSLSPQRHRRRMTEQPTFTASDRHTADLERLLELKNQELEAIRKAHSRRLERLRAVQHSEKLLQEQLKTMEEQQPLNRKKKKPPQRSNPRQLQREDSDAVWNELSYFKTQNRKLEVERLSLQEEVDELRVQASVDAASLHELRVNLQAQREEFEYQLKKRETTAGDRSEMESELVLLRSRMQTRDSQISQLEKDLQEMALDRDTLLEEKKLLKNQANELQQELSQSRIKVADLHHALQRQQRALEESAHTLRSSQSQLREAISHRSSEASVAGNRPPQRTRKPARTSAAKRSRANGGMPPLGRALLHKQYQRVLNMSIEKMRNLLPGFKEEGWEEVSESVATEDFDLDDEWEEEEDDTEATADSLGIAIARQARQTSPGADSTDTTASFPGALLHRKSAPVKGGLKMAQKSRRMPAKSKPSQARPTAKSAQHRITVKSPSPPSSSGEEQGPTFRDRIVLRETATSPIPWGAGAEEKAATARSKGVKVGGRQLSLLKQRIAHLQQQLAAFRDSRTLALAKFAELKASNEKLTSDLQQANQRLRTAKQNCQRLTSDVDRLQREKQAMEQQLSEQDRGASSEKQSDNDKRLLEARLKMSSSEVTRQASTIRSLKTEVDTLQDQIRGLQDRVNHLERDNNQKRNLVESQRIKLKSAQDASKTHDNAVEELQTKLKLAVESSEKMRVQLDSLKKRMRVVTQEKREYEDKYLQVSLALEKKAKDLSACREQRGELEAAMSQLEKLSQEQLQRVATHSEAAVDAAQAQVAFTHSTLTCYMQFVKLLASELVDRVARARAQLHNQRAAAAAREEQARDSDASLKRARDTARDILNISQSDLDDIMSADGDHAAEDANAAAIAAVEERRDRKWLRKCEKILTSKEDFVRPLVSLILQKVDERADLLMKLAS